jgi:predicted CXXCH cytochrome family protein
MARRWGTALGAVGALVCAGLGAAHGSECELARVDRARTTSQACMTCHDGSTGPGVGWVTSGGTGSSGQQRMPVPSHPVGIAYAPVALERPGKLVAPSRLPPELVLVNGRIECTTCHDARATAPDHVVRTPGLCLSCHTL